MIDNTQWLAMLGVGGGVRSVGMCHTLPPPEKKANLTKKKINISDQNAFYKWVKIDAFVTTTQTSGDPMFF